MDAAVTPWSTKDVESSKDAIAGGTNQVVSDLNDVKHLFRKLQGKWRRYGEDFSAFWNERLNEETRKNLMLTVSPHAPLSVGNPKSSTSGEDVSGAAKLLPELALNKIIGSGYLPNLYRQFLSENFDQAIRLSVDFIECHNIIDTSSFPRGFVTLHNMRWFEFKSKGTVQDLDELLAIDGVVRDDVVNAALHRLATVTFVLTSIFTEYEDEATKGPRKRLVNTIVGCNNPPCHRRKGKDGGRLKYCRACRRASYCSRSCQVMHWPAHKDFCKKHRAASVRSSGN